MNKQELEASLPWTEGNGWQRVGCGEGWVPLLAELNDYLLEVDPGYQVVQIKEKFGGLRYYVRLSDGLNERAAARCRLLIREAEEVAARTCETCGAPRVLSDPDEAEDLDWAELACTACE